jgi:tRNA nucleotidyltransferase/poly(A) polymerase
LDILITGVELDRLEHILVNYGKVKEVGKSFGIIKFVPFGETEDMDIAIPRTEIKKGEGYTGFEVTSDHTLPIESDLKRRDFTINSIAQDSNGNIIDPFGGVEDIKNKIIRATNEKTFEDDALRMIRSVQFSARFGFTIEPNTMAMIKKNASKIKEISSERYMIEFDKILKKGDIQMGMDILIDSGLFKEMFGFNYVGDRDFSKVKTMADLLYKLIGGIGPVAHSFIKKFLTNQSTILNQIKALELQEELMGDKLEDRKTVQKILNISSDIEESGLLKDDVKSIIKTFRNGTYPLNIKDLKINGNDLMSMGFSKEQIGKSLSLIMQAILSDKIPNKKEDIINFVEISNKSEVSDEEKNEQNKDVPPDSIYAINETRKIVKNLLFESFLDKSDDYKKWKKKNVTLRGVSNNPGEYNGVGSITLGDGFYTAHLGNKDMARKYGTVYYVVNGRPVNPLVFNNTNESEIWFQRNLYFKNFKDGSKFLESVDDATFQYLGNTCVLKTNKDVEYFMKTNFFENFLKIDTDLFDIYFNQNVTHPMI